MEIPLRTYLLAAASAAALLILYVLLFSAYTKNADVVNGYLIGLDMGAGNWRLAHWHLPLDNFWFQDALAYALATRLLGNHPVLMVIVPAVTWSGVTLSAWLMARRGAGVSDGAWPTIVIASLLAFPVMRDNPIMVFITVASDHMITLLQSLLALLLAQRYLRHGGGVSLIALLVLITAATAGDPIAVIIASAAIAGGAILTDEGDVPSRLRLVAVAVGAVFIGHGLVALNAAHGGFILQTGASTEFRFTPLADLAHNAFLSLEAGLGLWGADFFNLKLSDAAAQLARLPLFGVSAWVVWRIARQAIVGALRLQRAGGPFLDNALLVGIGALLSACLLSRVMVDFWAGRYLVPVYVYTAVLVARQTPPFRLRMTWGVLALGGSLLAVAAYPVRHWPTLRLPSATADLAAWLQHHRLQFGYAQYWTAAPLVAGSRNKVTALPLIAQDSRVVPYLWNTRDDWFPSPLTRSRPFFVIIDPPGPSDGRFTGAESQTTFGPPSQRVDVSGFEVDVYR